jgi:MerR family transcriptional regulator, light-induced transcriptional regulator
MLLCLARCCLLVYIRSKAVKGISYAYLVKSEWDKRRGLSVQHTIKYLGRPENIAINDIPEEYRNDPKILSFLSFYASKKQLRKEPLLKKLRADLFEALCNADREKAKEIALDYLKLFSLEEFYEDILTPVMYRIGDLWAQGSLSVITEHVCSNIAGSLIHAINAQSKPRGHKATVLICSPEGELHHLAADMFESILLQKGYEVYNAAPSAPAESIVKMIPTCNPHLIMISVTLQDHLRPAIRLTSSIRVKFKLPVLLGGLATRQLKHHEKQKIEESYKVSFISEASLEKIMHAVRMLASM